MIEKYCFYLVNINRKKVKFIMKSNNKNESIKTIKNNNINKEFINRINKIDSLQNIRLVLFKIEKVKYNENQPIKMIFGPIKITMEYYSITERGKIYMSKNEKLNNHLFITKKYIEKSNNELKFTKIKKYLKKMIVLSIKDKLEKRLLAPKLIDQVF